MAISGKPKRSLNPDTEQKRKADETEIIKMIDRGGTVPGETAKNRDSKFTLRVRSSLVEQMDEAVGTHPVINSRNTWIVNAIVEQLKREGLA